jgi:hypothetical protein
MNGFDQPIPLVDASRTLLESSDRQLVQGQFASGGQVRFNFLEFGGTGDLAMMPAVHPAQRLSWILPPLYGYNRTDQPQRTVDIGPCEIRPRLCH